MRIFDRQDWLRANRARARIKVFVDKFGIDELRAPGRGGARGRLGRRARLRPARRCSSSHDEEANAPAAAGRAYAQPERRRPRVRALRAPPTSCRSARRASRPSRSRSPAATSRPSSSAGSPQIMRDYSGGYARTTVHQNLVLRWVRDEARLRRLAARSASSASATPAPTRSTTSCQLPGHRLLQARHHQLDGPQPGGAASASSRWSIEDPLTKRIHIKMSGCPNGCSQHHIANIGFYGASIKVGEHTIPAYVAHIGGNYEGGEVALRHAPEGAPAGQARARRGRALDPHLRGRARGRRGVQRLRRARRRRRAFEDEVRDLALPVEFGLENMQHFIDWSARSPSRSSGARASARSDRRRPPRRPSRTRRRAPPPRARAGLLLPEGGVGADRHAACASSPTARVFTIDTGVLFPETYETWRKVEDRYGLRVEVVDADAAERHAVERVELLRRRARSTRSSARSPASTAWITGIRREQSPTRASAEAIEWDERARHLEVQPARATGRTRTCGATSHEHDLPYHPLHDQGLRLDRLRPLHPSRQRPRGPLGRAGQDRVRSARS